VVERSRLGARSRTQASGVASVETLDLVRLRAGGADRMPPFTDGCTSGQRGGILKSSVVPHAFMMHAVQHVFGGGSARCGPPRARGGRCLSRAGDCGVHGDGRRVGAAAADPVPQAGDDQLAADLGASGRRLHQRVPVAVAGARRRGVHRRLPQPGPADRAVDGPAGRADAADVSGLRHRPALRLARNVPGAVRRRTSSGAARVGTPSPMSASSRGSQVDGR